MKLITLEAKADEHHTGGIPGVRDIAYRTTYWEKGPAFYASRYLVHRVRQVSSYWEDGNHTHDIYHYWCAGVGIPKNNPEAGPSDTVPEGRLLCAVCEERAQAKGRVPADELAGRHVHIGRLKPIQVCCTEEREEN